ncbi:MAG: ABC transporter permease subunit [Candidatus Binatia bacterium]
MTGRQGLRLIGVATALLLPVSVITLGPLRSLVVGAPPSATSAGSEADALVGPPPPAKIRVSGVVPAALESRFVVAEESPYTLRGENPVWLYAPQVTPEIRNALDTLDGPVKLEVRTYAFKYHLPGRSLLIAILAVSLLTGPLADALPGERARRTLEVLLTTGITRGELIGGKWLAWTLSSTATALFAAAIACWRGIQEPGWWLLGLPLFIGSAVAFGLWLVRLVDDVVGGSAAPMRVLPVAAGTTALFAQGVSNLSPAAAAAVPLGGSLLVAADVFQSGSQLVAATVGTVVFIMSVLTLTGRDLDRVDTTSSPTRWGAVGLSAVATLLWWLSVAGPRVWGSGITTDLVTPMPRSTMVGGLALLACACVAIAREMRSGRVKAAPAPPVFTTVLATFAVAAALAVSGPLPDLDIAPARDTVQSMLDRLREGALPVAIVVSRETLLAAVLSIVGQVVLFRGVVAARAGWITASALWCFAVCPLSPWSALAASLALGALAAAHGPMAALVAHALWAVGASSGLAAGGAAAALGFQMIALVIALGASRLVRGAPMRHQL